MNYEKLYNDALERAKKWYNAPNADKIPTYCNRVIEEIFPELKEKETNQVIEPKFKLDLEKEIELVKGDYEQVDVAWNNDFDFIAKHFFELGLKVQKGGEE